MGSLTLPKLTVPDLVRLYEAGNTLYAISLRGGIQTARLRSILAEEGVRFRTQAEVVVLKNKARREHQARQAAKLERKLAR